MVMSKQSVVTLDCEKIKDGLRQYVDKTITVIIQERTKRIIKKGILVSISDKVFCIEAKLGKYNTCKISYPFLDIKTNKITIKEIPNLNDEVAQVL